MATILVVDDNESIVSALTEYLEASGYTVVSAADGPSALTVAAS